MANPAPLHSLLQSLATGHQAREGEIALFSELEASDLDEVRDRWHTLPVGSRIDILLRARTLAEARVELDFAAVGRIALDDPDADVRRAAIAALWESEDRETARKLTGLLQHDSEAAVRSDAALALGRFVLQCEFEAFDRSLGDTLVEALRQAVDDEREPLDVRARALQSLGYRSLPWVDTLITNAYYHDDRVLRLAAIHAMGSSANEKWLEYLEEDAQSDDPEVRFEAANAVGSIASEDGVDIVAEMLTDVDRAVVVAAIAALGEIGGEEAIRHLNEFAEEAEEEYQGAIRAALDAATFADEAPDPEAPFR